MSHKKHGLLTTSPEWAKHLRPLLRRDFWKGERRAQKDLIKREIEVSTVNPKLDFVEDPVGKTDVLIDQRTSLCKKGKSAAAYQRP